MFSDLALLYSVYSSGLIVTYYTKLEHDVTQCNIQNMQRTIMQHSDDIGACFRVRLQQQAPNRPSRRPRPSHRMQLDMVQVEAATRAVSSLVKNSSHVCSITSCRPTVIFSHTPSLRKSRNTVVAGFPLPPR